MSTKGIYTSLSGAIAQSRKLETIANNLANVNTPAFKKDQQTFKEYLTANEKPPTTIQVPRVTASIESFYDMQGGDKSYVDASGSFTDFTQGSLKSTGNDLDVAIEGRGFFEVDTPQGLRWTRNGAFKIDGNQMLVTKDGHPVLRSAEPGTAPQDRVIRFTGEGRVSISANGDVFQGENQVGRIALADVANLDHLHKEGGSLFTFKPNVQPEIKNAETASLKQGFIEMSNVNLVSEMTDMIGTTRTFETNQRAMSAYDSMNDKLVNVVGTLK